ncbi:MULTISPECIES: YybH family protein [Methylobacillus]|uniref:Conserved hypothetical signal peptide protein n=1 Tax=Methylobacillus flagellatus (strain ATCC 51484 / DSM 6875 / VKM B-1610 / KT) TaxID=265072 RepID=Q1GYR2_METFK|nr:MULTISPECIES: DUF4440 domain-containing protein [Methylobacillus]ABE50625.1 conserved hypothetical signal peptide protein [Methylobacillus flagellatus KT]MPS47774.1 DUF4440 domain-containing protein [Methylobacillus sp.]
MKISKVIVSIVLLALVAVAAVAVYKCNAKPNEEEARAIVSKLNSAWDAAFAEASAGTLASYYDANGSLLPAGGEQVTGNNDIADFWSGLFAKGFAEHQITTVETGIVGNTIYQRGKWSAVLKSADSEPQQFSGNLHILYKKQDDGSWKILTHTWN